MEMAVPFTLSMVMLEMLTRSIFPPSTIWSAIPELRVSKMVQLLMLIFLKPPLEPVPNFIALALLLIVQFEILILLHPLSVWLFKQIASSPLLIRQSESLTFSQSQKSKPSLFLSRLG
jgi:hypothetical protein